MSLLFPSLFPSSSSSAQGGCRPFQSQIDSQNREASTEIPETVSGCPFGGNSNRSNFWFGGVKREPSANQACRDQPGSSCRGGQEFNSEKKQSRLASHDDDADIDFRNMMPNIPNTTDVGLSTKRETSSIPKTGENKTWIYPSAAQFFRALQRNGKQAEKETVPAVVYVHNFVNEETWERIKELEKRHPECTEATLTRFCGRSDDLTLTARLMKLLGSWGELFDRHDWYIDRCGQQVRYIIDFYDDPKADNIAEVYIHARPAPFDSFVNLRDVVAHTLQSFWRGVRP